MVINQTGNYGLLSEEMKFGLDFKNAAFGVEESMMNKTLHQEHSILAGKLKK